MGNTKPDFISDALSGLVIYQAGDDTSSIFKKLSKDYNKRNSTAEAQNILHKIVDKDTLVMNVANLYMGEEMSAEHPADIEINKSADDGDTGLYELYVNVVKRFVDRMIEEGEYYAGIKGTPGVDAPIRGWVSRTGQVEGDPTVKDASGKKSLGHGDGMAYTYSGKQSIAEFNGTEGEDGVVEGCGAPENSWSEKTLVVRSTIDGIRASKCFECHTSSSSSWVKWADDNDLLKVVQTDAHSPAVDSTYKGDLENNTCRIGEGKRNYPGLYKTEYDYRNEFLLLNEETQGEVVEKISLPQFKNEYWAGIDCAGFIQRSILGGQSLAIPGTKTIDKDTDWLHSSEFTAASKNISFYVPFGSSGTLKNGRSITQKAKEQRYLKKGDVVYFSAGHVVMVYSDRSTKNKKNDLYKYDVINAFGDGYVTKKDKNDKSYRQFTRRVMVMPNTMTTTIQNPTSFGRLRLWD